MSSGPWERDDHLADFSQKEKDLLEQPLPPRSETHRRRKKGWFRRQNKQEQDAASPSLSQNSCEVLGPLWVIMPQDRVTEEEKRALQEIATLKGETAATSPPASLPLENGEETITAPAPTLSRRRKGKIHPAGRSRFKRWLIGLLLFPYGLAFLFWAKLAVIYQPAYAPSPAQGAVVYKSWWFGAVLIVRPPSDHDPLLQPPNRILWRFTGGLR